MDPSNIILTIISTMVGIIAGWIITVKLTKSKKPIWFWGVNQLFQKGVSTISDLRITYKNNDIRNLSTIFLAFWNDGKETITREMIVKNLYFKSKNKKAFLDAQVVYVTTESNEFTVSVEENGSFIKLDFRYLDYKQGAVIQIFSDRDNVEEYMIDGAIMGCQRFKNFIKNKRIERIIRLFKNLIPAIYGLITTVLGFSILYNRSFIKNNSFIIWLLFCAFFIIFIISLIIIENLYKDTRYRMPKEFKKFFNGITHLR